MVKANFSRVLSCATQLGGERKFFVLLVADEGWLADLEERSPRSCHPLQGGGDFFGFGARST